MKRRNAKVAEIEAMTHLASSLGIGSSFIHQDVDGTLQVGVGNIVERNLIYEKVAS